MREIVHLQAGQCGNQIGAKVNFNISVFLAPCVRPLFAFSNFLPNVFPDSLLKTMQIS